jgi:ribosomal protein L11 methyltransferase
VTREWIEVQIESSVDAGELLGMLDDPAVTGAWEENGIAHLYWPADQWNPDTLAGLKQALHRLAHVVTGSQRQGLNHTVTVNRLPEQDWNELWARSVQPIRIGRRVLIRPSWKCVELQPGEIELILTPGRLLAPATMPPRRC